ncbi:DUF5694 domain-containing protein [Qipengyuania vesicularis]|uniref:DUF5694 domain-containing protein n=1 Tax=Qipengyuania vesicularis TaxID=2867232 RepID=UPI001C8674BB|nr:DUF5694 domain-containing protein [Qipengyuania vesicularis]MBX7527231.1 hypothetical protein [Qipengyuania vesicularis]
MNLKRLIAAVASLLAVPATAQADEATQPDTEVMVLGVYHFANPGLDAVNIEVGDVLAVKRQREIRNLVDVLAEWGPTRIAVEAQAKAPELTLPDYARTEELLGTRRNESVQIGFRLARQLGHDEVFGYDEQPGEGEPDYFPMGKVQSFAAENGGMELLQSLFDELQVMAAEEQAALPTQSIAESLLQHNDPDRVGAMHDKLYYSLLSIGNGDAQPGAELNAYWYMRNAKMFSKIDMFAEPGDRILVIAGSGHATWLRHFVRRMPGYKLVEPMPYLVAAAALDGATD